MVKAGLTFFVLLLIAQPLFAEIRLPAIVSSNMVLQRNTTVRLWGWAEVNEKITIETSWLRDEIETWAEDNGQWSVSVETTGSKSPQNVSIRSNQSDISLDNILFGEVWLCSGQSNMGLALKGYRGQPVFGSNMAVAKSNNPNLRLFTVERAGSKTKQDEIGKHIGWQQASPESVSGFSAVAYFFGQQLQEILDVPIGLIHSSCGASSIEAWMSEEALVGLKKVDLTNVDVSRNVHQIPTALFNAMINPLVAYTIKGVLWYQGEGNMTEPEMYKKLFPAMVKDWRDRWGLGNFPFYFTQIAPFIYGGNEAFQSVQNSAFFREAQLQCLDLIPNSGIAITIDIGDDYCIHPPKKERSCR